MDNLKQILFKLFPERRETFSTSNNIWNYQKKGQLFLKGKNGGISLKECEPLLWETEFRIAKHPQYDIFAYASSRCPGIENNMTSCICLYNDKDKSDIKIIHDLENYPRHGFDLKPAFSPKGKWIAFLSMKEYGKIGKNGTIMISTYSYTRGKEKVYTLTMTKNLSCSNFLWINDNTILVEYNSKGYSKVCAISFNPNNPSKNNRITHIGNLKLKIADERGFQFIPKSFYFSGDKDLSFLNPGKVEHCEYLTSDNITSYYWIAHHNPDINNHRTLLLCQGGPHHAWEPEIECGAYHIPLLQHLGYSIIMPIVHGMPGISQEFDDQVRGDWGGQCIQDYIDALDTAIVKHGLDKNYVAVMGHSFGGFCAYSMNVQHPEKFRCVVSESGPFNLESFKKYCLETQNGNVRNQTMKCEMYNGLANPEGEKVAEKMIREQSPHNLIENCKEGCKPILIIHGKDDNRVPYEQAEEAQKSFGCECKLYEGEGHVIGKRVEYKIDRYLRILKFLNTHMT